MIELELNNRIFNYFSSQNKKVFSEVQFLRRRIDIVVIENSKICTFELKIQKWRRSILQMQTHRICGGYCSLIMPQENVSKKLKKAIIKELKFYGYGFYVWDDEEKELKCFLEAKKHECRSKIEGKKLLEILKKEGKNNENKNKGKLQMD